MQPVRLTLSASCCPLPQRPSTSYGQLSRCAAAMPAPAAVSELAKADAAKSQYIILAECGPACLLRSRSKPPLLTLPCLPHRADCRHQGTEAAVLCRSQRAHVALAEERARMGELLAENRRLAAEAEASGRDCWEVVAFLRSELLAREAEAARLTAAFAQAGGIRAWPCGYFSSRLQLRVTEGVESPRWCGLPAPKRGSVAVLWANPAALRPEGCPSDSHRDSEEHCAACSTGVKFRSVMAGFSAKRPAALGQIRAALCPGLGTRGATHGRFISFLRPQLPSATNPCGMRAMARWLRGLQMHGQASQPLCPRKSNPDPSLTLTACRQRPPWLRRSPQRMPQATGARASWQPRPPQPPPPPPRSWWRPKQHWQPRLRRARRGRASSCSESQCMHAAYTGSGK